MTMDEPEEFVCVECGSQIVRIIARPTEPKLCAHCIHLPGWHTDPKLREIFGEPPQEQT